MAEINLFDLRAKEIFSGSTLIGYDYFDEEGLLARERFADDEVTLRTHVDGAVTTEQVPADTWRQRVYFEFSKRASVAMSKNFLGGRFPNHPVKFAEVLRDLWQSGTGPTRQRNRLKAIALALGTFIHGRIPGDTT